MSYNIGEEIMKRRFLLSTPLAGLAACQSTTPTSAGYSTAFVDDGVRILRPQIRVRSLANSSKLLIDVVSAEAKTGALIRLAPGGAFKVNGVSLALASDSSQAIFAGEIAKAEKLEVEILRNPNRHTRFAVELPTLQAVPINVPWSPPNPLELRIVEARGINPLAVRDELKADAMSGDSRVHAFITPENFKLSQSDGIISLKFINIPYGTTRRRYITKLRVLRVQRIGLAELTSDYDAGWVLFAINVPEINFEVVLPKSQ